MQQSVDKRLCLLLISFTLTLLPGWLNAQSAGSATPSPDTLRLNVQQAEARFLQKNLTLLADQYNVDINKALVQQAKVWDNPTLVTDQNIYDGKFFRHNTENGQQYGQIYVQVQQLIRTAGKIKKQTELAQDNVLGAEAQFNDVMRNLKFVLTTDLNNLAQLQNMAQIYQGEIQTMQPLAKGMDDMLKLGDVSQKENIRIKALLFSLQNDYNDNIRQQLDLQKEIGSLLQTNDNNWIVVEGVNTFTQDQVNNLKITSLQDSALLQRPDLAFAKSQLQFQQHNVDYQKALATPDLTVGVEYDKLNSYVPNYYGLGLSLPIPLFNRNKGNIQAAGLAAKQSEVVAVQVRQQVSKDVWTAWQKLLNATSLINNDNEQLKDNYDLLMKNMLSSYRQRQVNLVEFIDFVDAYRDTRIKQWQLVTNQRNAAAELNYAMNQNTITL